MHGYVSRNYKNVSREQFFDDDSKKNINDNTDKDEFSNEATSGSDEFVDVPESHGIKKLAENVKDFFKYGFKEFRNFFD